MRLQAITPMMSDSFMIRSSSPSSLTSVPDHLPNSTRSPALTPMMMSLPFSSRPRPDGDDLALLWLLLDRIGNDDAALGPLLGFDALDDHPIMQGPKLQFCHDLLIAAVRRLSPIAERLCIKAP